MEMPGGSGDLRRASPRTTLAQDGAVQECDGSAGREKWCCCKGTFDPLASLPSTARGGEAAWRGEEYCEPADPVDSPAPSAHGKGGPPPPLQVGGEAAGNMVG